MEVDHFNPTLKERERNNYKNLMLSTRQCNGSKWNYWPTSSETKKHGRRFLNPCEELEYGEHIVEHPETHELIGLTPAGSYHVDFLDLNNPGLVQARSDRWHDHVILEKTVARLKQDHHPDSFPVDVVKNYREMASANIPLFPFATEEQVLSYEHKMARQR